ncbi:MAG TPA: hypothetical protein VFE32_13320 [Puia sp.]|jgi:hypothetical protein|nr:hypothetical protein [Puia sp.]
MICHSLTGTTPLTGATPLTGNHLITGISLTPAINPIAGNQPIPPSPPKIGALLNFSQTHRSNLKKTALWY